MYPPLTYHLTNPKPTYAPTSNIPANVPVNQSMTDMCNNPPMNQSTQVEKQFNYPRVVSMEDLLLRDVGVNWGSWTHRGSYPANNLLKQLLHHLLGLLGLQFALTEKTKPAGSRHKTCVLSPGNSVRENKPTWLRLTELLLHIFKKYF